MKLVESVNAAIDAKSHPTGVRGLKCLCQRGHRRQVASHPTGVRGLKLIFPRPRHASSIVAPHWGAWIEMPTGPNTGHQKPSHPTGVRGLKLSACIFIGVRCDVAPHWGAWIEIRPSAHLRTPAGGSHPTGVRGLKCARRYVWWVQRKSHPTGVRGLKYLKAATDSTLGGVAPHWGAWIEITRNVTCR